MSRPSLHEIEKTLCSLWMNREVREAFLYGAGTKKKHKRPAPSVSLAPELLEQIDKNGVRLYASLLNIGHKDLMVNVFPGCAKLIGDKWPEVVDHYLEQYPPNHYNLNRSAERFSEYLSRFGDRYLRKYPFIAELADYEWLELELLEHRGQIKTYTNAPLTSPADFESLRPVVNPVLAVRRYRFPIPTIVDHLEDDCCLPKDVAPKPATVLVYRDPQSHACRFLEVGEMTAKIVQATLANSLSYKELAALAVSEAQGMDPQQCLVEFIEMVEKLQSLGLFVGSVPI